MDADVRRQFDKVDLRLTKAEERVVSQDKVLSAVRKLLLVGAKALQKNDRQISEINDLLKALTAAQLVTEEKLQRFEETMDRFEKKTERWLDSQSNGHNS